MGKKECKCKEDVKMSVPEGMEFNTQYTIPNETMDHTIHNHHYWDFERNGRVDISNTFSEELDTVIKEITNLLKIKNKAYGNTALNPTNVFSKLNATEALCARIDDKLARISNRGINDETEDTVDDLIGYLLLLKMSM
jgi:DnaJ-class molecular chaperone